jgi:hypothetical protein
MRNTDLSYGWDLSLDPNTLNIRSISGTDYTAQKIRQVLQVFLGEWWLDEAQGFPYFEMLLGIVRPDLTACKAYMVTMILAVPGVTSVDSLDITTDNATRKASISFTATLSDGTTTTQTVSPGI